MHEFGFELALCAHLETPDRIVSRQLGGHVHGRRVVDTVLLEPGPRFEQRAAITEATIPPSAIEAPVERGHARPVSEVFDCHPERVTTIVEAGVECGFIERERRNGRTLIRQTCPYPEEWFGRLRAIENKPDLERPGDLEAQLRTDVSLGLFDQVVLATSSHVTGAHLNRLPAEVGVWRFDPETGERAVIREATVLPVDGAGVEICDRKPGRATIRIVDAEAKARARRRIAERAYGKGWRTFEPPACARVDLTAAGCPDCAWKERIVQPAVDCGEGCTGHEPAAAPERERRTRRGNRSAWEPDPVGGAHRQVGLQKFSEDETGW